MHFISYISFVWREAKLNPIAPAGWDEWTFTVYYYYIYFYIIPYLLFKIMEMGLDGSLDSIGWYLFFWESWFAQIYSSRKCRFKSSVTLL